MTDLERQNTLDVLHSLRFDSLPPEALIFLRGYLVTSEALCKVSYLLDEAARLNDIARHSCEPHHEHVDFPAS